MKRIGLISAAVVIATLASGSQTSSSRDPAGSGILLRVAFMMGSRGDAELPASATDTMDPRAFDGWDPTADNPELQNLLGLRQLAELARATVTMPPGQRNLSLTVVADRRRYELAVEPAERRDNVVYLGLAIREDGRDVSQPRVGLQVGQKGVVCARVARGDDEAFVFFVLQMDEL